MKNKLLLSLFLFGLVVAAGAQAVTIGFSPRTGDVWVDTRLGDINSYGSGNPNGFIDDVVGDFGVPRPLVRDLYYDRGWAPGDIYFACAIAQQLGRPCLEVVDYYESNRGQGWGVVAQRLGIKPGSSAFHALKGRVGKGHERLHGRGGPKASGGPKGGRDAGPSQGRGQDGGTTGKGDKGKGDKGNGNKGKGDKGNGKGR